MDILGKKIIISASVVALALLSSAPAFAVTSTSSANAKNVRVDLRVTNLKEKADREIDRRITSLNNITNKINAMKKLSVSDKQSFSLQIQTEITNLTTLKTKIDADTDLPTLKTDVQSIVKSYRVYALFIPKLGIIIAADRMGETADNLDKLAGKLQTKIQDAQASGKNVSSLQTLLADMQKQTADARTQYSAASSEVMTLTPEGYPGNKSTLQDARSKLKTAHTDLKKAGQDARKIINELKGPKDTPKATSSANIP